METTRIISAKNFFSFRAFLLLVIVSFSKNRKWRLLTDLSAIVNLTLLSRVTL